MKRLQAILLGVILLAMLVLVFMKIGPCKEAFANDKNCKSFEPKNPSVMSCEDGSFVKGYNKTKWTCCKLPVDPAIINELRDRVTALEARLASAGAAGGGPPAR